MKAIKASHHNQILRLSNDDAALLVSSGRWVYISKFEAREAALKPRRRWHWLVGAGLAAAALATLFWAGTAHAADKPVPFRVCLTMEQAIATYKGKKIGTPRYREIGKNKERCWYIAAKGKVAAKAEFIPRFAGATVTPTRLLNKEQQRVQAVPVGSSPAAGAITYEAMIDDAFLALTGRPESDFTFDAYWTAMTGWKR